MSEIKLTADSGGGTVSLKGPATTTGNAAVPFVLPVADGSAGQYLKTDGSKNLGWGSDADTIGGITHASEWRVTSNYTWDTGIVLNANWEESDDATYTRLGSAMTESSGIFTFPTTGIWKIEHQIHATITDASRRVFESSVGISTNSGSSYDNVAQAVGNLHDSGGATGSSARTAAIVDVTNASTFRVRFYFYATADTIVYGHSDVSATSAMFIRLGDT